MTERPFDVSWLGLAYSLALVLVAVAISAWLRLGLMRALVVSALRATVQLLLIAQVLLWLFRVDQWWVVALALFIMLVVAAATASGRLASQSSRRTVFLVCLFAIGLGAASTLAFVVTFSIPIEPWYNPRYLIPLFGMIVANAMNSATLSMDRLAAELSLRRAEIESYLVLGAPPAEASANAVKSAMVAAMIPVINTMAVVGIVSLPGMMTGQIIAGSSPDLAVRYQLVILFALTGASALSAAVAVLFQRRASFTEDEQMRPAAD